MRRWTILDVAERAGVSVGTVSNALNRPEIVAEKTLATIRQAIDELDYVPSAAARQMTGARNPAIGLIVLDIENPFFTEVYRGVEAVAGEAGYVVVVCSFAGDPEHERRQLRLLEEQRVAGILATRVGKGNSRVYGRMRKSGMPVVMLDRRAATKDQCSVSVDDVAGGRLAGEHLCELGHRRLALVNGPHDWSQCADRRKGFVAAAEAAGAELLDAADVEVEQMTIEAGEQAAREILAADEKPTGIFCANDLLALGVEHALIAAGHRVPEDFAIVGYDDVAFATMAFVPLTSVRQPAYELGRRAAEQLLNEADDQQHRHERVVFEPELVVRASTVAAIDAPLSRA
ncbi:LacI family DNA-binding transcriptional regulator [Patulibacter defluvii]|uniref:LacI family DNA-binding transcriptional regulator n=1 Tax=Patulibacter defluvii TaxID=3095358 RepID=UPI002A74BE5B|nr:LacI family DNA-binding transcriptional regulator [Patulibacter sp. DM4]